MPNSAPLIGSAQAAARFGVDRATFNRWVKAGKVPFVHAMDGATGARLFDADTIDQLADAHRAATGGGDLPRAG